MKLEYVQKYDVNEFIFYIHVIYELRGRLNLLLCTYKLKFKRNIFADKCLNHTGYGGFYQVPLIS